MRIARYVGAMLAGGHAWPLRDLLGSGRCTADPARGGPANSVGRRTTDAIGRRTANATR
jgi:hypothetical protein